MSHPMINIHGRRPKKKPWIWYHIGYDTCGNGFCSLPEPYCWALGEDELEEAVLYTYEKYEVDQEDICIFELTKKKVKLPRKRLSKR